MIYSLRLNDSRDSRDIWFACSEESDGKFLIRLDGSSILLTKQGVEAVHRLLEGMLVTY